MKISLFVFFLSVAHASIGQFQYEEVVSVEDSVEASVIYLAGLKFYQSVYAESKLELNDQSDYAFIGPAVTTFQYLSKNMYVQFRLDVRFKKGRYKYSIDNIMIDTNGGGSFYLADGVPSTMVGKKVMPDRAHHAVLDFIDHMKQSIAEYSRVSNNDW